MTRRFCLALVLLLGACASQDRPPKDLKYPNGCFELPIGQTKDGKKPLACTMTGGGTPTAQGDDAIKE